jgi:hypothetical protein
MRLISCILLAVICVSCGRDEAPGRDTSRPGFAAVFAPAGCYRSATSVLGRTTPLAGRTSVAPGWLRFETSTGADSGGLQLIDADGAAFRASWRRLSRDSVEISGFDDFMRIGLRVAHSDSALTGTGLLTSDAEVHRDAAGRLEPLRREWKLDARRSSCDSIPAVAS